MISTADLLRQRGAASLQEAPHGGVGLKTDGALVRFLRSLDLAGLRE